MRDGWFERLTEVMARLAAGEPAALGELYTEFGGPIRWAVRAQLRSLGVTRFDPDDLEGLVLDVCLDLGQRAGSWDPAHGATPWKWAERRIRSMVCDFIGPFTDPLPEGGPGELPSVSEPVRAGSESDDVLAALDRLAAARDDIRLLYEALQLVSRPGQQVVLLEVRMQAGQGDPSPAVTVARVEGLRADAVRQICKRLLDALRRLIDTDPYFAPLAGLPLLQKAA